MMGPSYQPSDVRVGDVVWLDYYHTNGQDLCREFIIYRRPGGKIPPWPGDAELKTTPEARHHARVQAYQDWEEKGTPIPARYQPVPSKGIGVPYPPAAPQPREVKPKAKA